jgi:hypothetical protein
VVRRSGGNADKRIGDLEGSPVSDILPGSAVIAEALKIAGMAWMWEVFNFAINGGGREVFSLPLWSDFVDILVN